jgi:hypothetical protein
MGNTASKDLIRLPNLAELAQDVLGAPYTQYSCFGLMRYLIRAGFGWDLVDDPHQAAAEITEIWFRGDGRDPVSLLQPWDCWMLSLQDTLPWTDHVGLVIDAQHWVHSRRRVGVVIEPLRRWQPKLLQVARLRRLL